MRMSAAIRAAIRRAGRWRVLAPGLAAIVLAGCGEPPAPPPSEEAVAAVAATELKLVVVGEYPAAAVAELGGFLRWLNAGLAPGSLRMSAEVASSVPEAADWLASGAVDFYLDSPYPVLLARQVSGCRPILRRWKFGTPTYHSVIFARADSGVDELADLRGKTIAFEDRYSSSSFFMPVDVLFSADLAGAVLATAEDPVPPDRLGFVFSGGDATTMHWVLAGKVVAGAANRWNFDRYAGESRDQLRVLATSGEVPRHLMAARKDLDPRIEETIRDLLLGAHLSAAGREMLAGFSSTDRFDDVPGDFLRDVDRLQATVVRLNELADELLASGGEP